jgi:class 3 adenylate cyclase
MLNRLSQFVRVVEFDRRGTGLSDRPDRPLTIEDRVDDVLAVIDATASDQVAVLGVSDGAATAVLLGAARPDRVSRLLLYAPLVRTRRSVDFPWGTFESRQELVASVDQTLDQWGEASASRRISPGATETELELLARYQRMAITPKGFRDAQLAALDIDIRPVLSALSVPTLVLHKSADPVVPVGQGRYLAANVAGARIVELSGTSHLLADDDVHTLIDEIVGCLTGLSPSEDPDRVLATMLFTDLVASTGAASTWGDRRWRDVLSDHDELVHDVVVRHRGRIVSTTGDGVLAVFDGPARAVRAALAIVHGVRALRLEARAGVHTGEVELRAKNIAGIAVHIAARIAALAQPGQVLVSRTVVDLVAGSQLHFTELGEYSLRGVPGSWQLLEVDTGSPC